MITAETNLGWLLDQHPELVEVLAGCHDHFTPLRNLSLWPVMAPRVTIGQAAAGPASRRPTWWPSCAARSAGRRARPRRAGLDPSRRRARAAGALALAITLGRVLHQLMPCARRVTVASIPRAGAA
jgi:hypothetical protein